MSDFEILEGDVMELLPMLPENHVQTVITSPPYWALRKYGEDPRELGSEKTFEEYIRTMVNVFEEVRRVLKPHGTLWLNIGDSYADGTHSNISYRRDRAPITPVRGTVANGLKPKDLIGQPWSLAFAFRKAGWFLRSDIIWSKSNSMPESVKDRPTKAHEYIFLFSKSPKYFFDYKAISEDKAESTLLDKRTGEDLKRPERGFPGKPNRGATKLGKDKDLRNKRSVWELATAQFKEAHYATFPPALVLPCVLAGTRPGDLVFDPFSGAGTVGKVAIERGRRYLGIELYAKNHEITNRRIAEVQPGLPLNA